MWNEDAIGVMRLLGERSIDFKKDVFVCFVDFEKAFDRVNWTKLMEILKQIGIDCRDRRPITRLYMNQTASVRTNMGNTEPAIIGRGIREGCLMSPTLFNIYAEAVVREALDGVSEGIKFGGKIIMDVRFAYDQAMIASTETGLME